MIFNHSTSLSLLLFFYHSVLVVMSPTSRREVRKVRHSIPSLNSSATRKKREEGYFIPLTKLPPGKFIGSYNLPVNGD